MRSIRLSLSAVLLASAVLSTSALAQPALVPANPPPPNPDLAQQALVPGNPPPTNPDEEWHFAISPRVWFRTNNIVSGPAFNCGNFGSFSAFCSNSQAALSFVMVGGSLAIEPPMLQGGPHPTDIVITSYGGPSQQLSSQQVVFSDQFLGEEKNFVGRGSRVDSEILGRTSLDPTGSVRVVYGLRWLRNTTTVTSNFVSPFVPPSVVPHLPITTETDSLLGEGGMQFAVPIGQTPHSVFGGVILGFGNSSDLHSAAEAFMDASLGYSYALTDSLAPYLRYRFQVFAPFKGGPFLDNVQVVHGPEVGFTLRF